MKFCKQVHLLLAILLITITTEAQQSTVTLPQLIQQATNNSLQQQIATTTYTLGELQYKDFTLQQKPNLVLNGNAPVYDKDNFSVRQPDGTIRFLNRSQINSNINLGFVQPIVATGGTISVNTSLNRFDELIGKNTTYNGTPIYIQLQQPLFAFNTLKWQRKIQPLKLRNAANTVHTSQYTIAYNVATAFFALATLTVQKELLQEQTIVNQQSIKVALRKKELGNGDANQLLQLEVQKLSMQQELASLQTTIINTTNNLNNLLQQQKENYSVVLPTVLPNITINSTALLDSIKNNNPTIRSNAIAQLELLAEKERLQKEKTTINLLLSYGLNQSGNALRNVYNNVNDQQRFNIGFAIPLADWGKRKNIAAQNEVQQKLLSLQEKEQLNNLQIELSNTYNTLAQLKANYTTGLQLDSVAKLQYTIAVGLYNNGKTTFLELQQAAAQRNSVKLQVFNSVKEYYLLLYKLQQICGCTIL